MKEIICFKLENDLDLVLAHRRSMQLAAMCGLNLVAQTGFATAVSEVARFMIEQGKQSQLSLQLGRSRANTSVVSACIESPIFGEIDLDNDNFKYARKLVSQFDILHNVLSISSELPKSVALSASLIKKCEQSFKAPESLSAYEEVKRKNGELQQLADSLVESETRYQELTNSLPLMMFTLDADHHLVYANDWFLQFTSTTLESIKFTNWFDWIKAHHLDVDYSALRTKLEQKLPFQLEVILTFGESKIWHLLSLTPQNGNSGAIKQWFGFIVNIDAQKVVEQTLRDNQELKLVKEIMEVREKQLDQTIEELNRSNQELARYAYVASHDLQEPVRKVRVLADLVLQKYSDQIPSEGVELLTRTQKSAERMHMIVKDLLAYSRLNSTTMSLKENVDLKVMVDLAVENLDVLMQAKGASVSVRNSVQLNGNAVQLLLLFQNLIANAIKFTAKHITPVIQITADTLSAQQCDAMRLNSANKWFCIGIKDNGIGFDQSHAERIFEVFQRLHSRSEYDGTGIGLSICKKIVELHGGKINVTSSPGAGSTFLIYLAQPAS